MVRLLSALFGAALIVSTPALASAGEKRVLTELSGEIRERANFVEVCRFSHRAPDDPIVHPNHGGASHSHDFFGNVSTSASSTVSSLQAAGTTCREMGDTAAYWVPTLYQDGKAIDPLLLRIYYRAGRRADFASIQPFPAGLRVIAGDSNRQTASSGEAVRWSCREEAVPKSPSPPVCEPGANLRLHIRFPDCWDGASVDSPDHKSHLAYPGRRGCPASHPVRVPQLTQIIHYPIVGEPGSITLASGSTFSAHADFFNAWNQAVLERKVRECLNATVVCGARGSTGV